MNVKSEIFFLNILPSSSLPYHNLLSQAVFLTVVFLSLLQYFWKHISRNTMYCCKTSKHTFSYHTLGVECDWYDIWIWSIMFQIHKGSEINKYSRCLHGIKPKRTFAMSYIFTNVRYSSKISSTALLEIHSKWEKVLWGNLFWIGRWNTQSLVLPAASARFCGLYIWHPRHQKICNCNYAWSICYFSMFVKLWQYHANGLKSSKVTEVAPGYPSTLGNYLSMES